MPKINVSDELHAEVKRFAAENNFTLQRAYERLVAVGFEVYNQVQATTPSMEDLQKILKHTQDSE